MSLSVLGHSLEKLGISAKLVLLLLLTYRYIFVIEQEYRKLRRAAAIRSFHPGTNMHTYKTCLSYRNAFCKSLRTRPTRPSGHALPGI
jgi:energy-coupling factor transporter transmembrane protein EcfT